MSECVCTGCGKLFGPGEEHRYPEWQHEECGSLVVDLHSKRTLDLVFAIRALNDRYKACEVLNAFRERVIRECASALGASGDYYVEQDEGWLLDHFKIAKRAPPPEPVPDPLTVAHYGFPKP